MIRLEGSNIIHATPHEGTHVIFFYDLGEKPATVQYWLENDGQRLNGDSEIELTGKGSIKVRMKEPENKGDIYKPTMLRVVVKLDSQIIGEESCEFLPASVNPMDLEGYAIRIHHLPGDLGVVTVAGKLDVVFVRVEGLKTTLRFRFYATFGMQRGDIQGYVFKPGRDGWYQIPAIVFPDCKTDSAKGISYWFKAEVGGAPKRMAPCEMILDVAEFQKRFADTSTRDAYDDAGIVNP
jgi:hypothetical protein